MSNKRGNVLNNLHGKNGFVEVLFIEQSLAKYRSENNFIRSLK